MIAVIAALFLAAADTPPAAPDQTPAPAAQTEAEPGKGAPPADRPPADISQAVDAHGVPRWAKQKKRQMVQNCPAETPNIGVQTWRDRYETTGVAVLKPKSDTVTCK